MKSVFFLYVVLSLGSPTSALTSRYGLIVKRQNYHCYGSSQLLREKGIRFTDRKLSAKSHDSDGEIVEHNLARKRTVAMTALVLQQSLLSLLIRSNRVGKRPSEMFITSTAVVMSEFVKILASIAGCYYEDCNGSKKQLGVQIKRSGNIIDMFSIAVPAGLYVLYNNLQYVALSNLPAEVYQVLLQGKIIATAVFSALIMKRVYSAVQWMSVVALSIGVALVQYSLKAPTNAASAATAAINFPLGITSVLISALSSGFASVYLEKILKKRDAFWIRNIQLSVVSLIIAVVSCFFGDFSIVREKGFFFGYDPMVWAAILVQALGGMVVALVVRFTNSVVKGFAASGSIIFSCAVSAMFLKDYKLNGLFMLGTAIVSAAAVAWAIPSRSAATTTVTSTNNTQAQTSGGTTLAHSSLPVSQNGVDTVSHTLTTGGVITANTTPLSNTQNSQQMEWDLSSIIRPSLDSTQIQMNVRKTQ